LWQRLEGTAQTGVQIKDRVQENSFVSNQAGADSSMKSSPQSKVKTPKVKT
jgi:hypothetical protein